MFQKYLTMATLALLIFFSLPQYWEQTDVARADTPSPVPQIMLTDAILADLRARIDRIPTVAADAKQLLADADAFLQVPTIVDEFHIDHKGQLDKLPGVAQKSVERLTTLAMAWRLSGDQRFADRGRLELLGLARLETWYPAHFLGLSRITLAVSLGYSWLGDA
ncbi:MAG: hypothetical protein ABJO38_26035, partial [Stappiaceae bacterium]